jgi:hypothetical protein
MSAKKIIENYYNNKNQFSTLYIKSSARYSDNKQTNFGKHSISRNHDGKSIDYAQVCQLL